MEIFISTATYTLKNVCAYTCTCHAKRRLVYTTVENVNAKSASLFAFYPTDAKHRKVSHSESLIGQHSDGDEVKRNKVTQVKQPGRETPTSKRLVHRKRYEHYHTRMELVNGLISLIA